MTPPRKRLAGVLLGLNVLGWSSTASADDWRQNLKIDNCATIPAGAQPAPLGTYINRFIKAQAEKAELDDFVLYKHMWYRGGADLGPLGRYQLDLISSRLATQPFPVIIETSKNDKLDDQRRRVILAMLKLRGMDDPARVLVAYPIAGGLYGDEAPRVYNGLIGLYSFYNNNGSFNNNNAFNGSTNFGGSNFGGFGGVGGIGGIGGGIGGIGGFRPF
jgi:hypothetical protein